MQLALAHPDLGYYMNRDPFGAKGDFTTAPEIFADVRRTDRALGGRSMVDDGLARSRAPVEFGPGRGTLMSDALRAARIVPDFRAALDVRLIETSPALAAIQHEMLVDCGVPVSWAQSSRRCRMAPRS